MIDSQHSKAGHCIDIVWHMTQNMRKETDWFCPNVNFSKGCTNKIAAFSRMTSRGKGSILFNSTMNRAIRTVEPLSTVKTTVVATT